MKNRDSEKIRETSLVDLVGIDGAKEGVFERSALPSIFLYLFSIEIGSCWNQFGQDDVLTKAMSWTFLQLLDAGIPQRFLKACPPAISAQIKQTSLLAVLQSIDRPHPDMEEIPWLLNLTIEDLALALFTAKIASPAPPLISTNEELVFQRFLYYLVEEYEKFKAKVDNETRKDTMINILYDGESDSESSPAEQTLLDPKVLMTEEEMKLFPSETRDRNDYTETIWRFGLRGFET